MALLIRLATVNLLVVSALCLPTYTNWPPAPAVFVDPWQAGESFRVERLPPVISPLAEYTPMEVTPSLPREDLATRRRPLRRLQAASRPQFHFRPRPEHVGALPPHLWDEDHRKPYTPPEKPLLDNNQKQLEAAASQISSEPPNFSIHRFPPFKHTTVQKTSAKPYIQNNNMHHISTYYGLNPDGELDNTAAQSLHFSSEKNSPVIKHSVEKIPNTPNSPYYTISKKYTHYRPETTNGYNTHHTIQKNADGQISQTSLKSSNNPTNPLSNVHKVDGLGSDTAAIKITNISDSNKEAQADVTQISKFPILKNGKLFPSTEYDFGLTPFESEDIIARGGSTVNGKGLPGSENLNTQPGYFITGGDSIRENQLSSEGKMPARKKFLQRYISRNRPGKLVPTSDEVKRILKLAKLKFKGRGRIFRVPANSPTGELVSDVFQESYNENADRGSGYENIVLTENDLLMLIPILIDELKAGELTTEEQKIFHGVFGDLWPIMMAEGAARQRRERLNVSSQSETAPAADSSTWRGRSALRDDLGAARRRTTSQLAETGGPWNLQDFAMVDEGADNGARWVDTRSRGRPSSRPKQSPASHRRLFTEMVWEP